MRWAWGSGTRGSEPLAPDSIQVMPCLQRMIGQPWRAATR